MSGIFTGIGHLFQAVVDVIQGIISTIFSIFSGFFNLVLDLISNVFNLFEGFVGFILGNIVTLGVIGLLAFGFIVYQQRQGKTVKVS